MEVEKYGLKLYTGNVASCISAPINHKSRRQNQKANIIELMLSFVVSPELYHYVRKREHSLYMFWVSEGRDECSPEEIDRFCFVKDCLVKIHKLFLMDDLLGSIKIVSSAMVPWCSLT